MRQKLFYFLLLLSFSYNAESNHSAYLNYCAYLNNNNQFYFYNPTNYFDYPTNHEFHHSYIDPFENSHYPMPEIFDGNFNINKAPDLLKIISLKKRMASIMIL